MLTNKEITQKAREALKGHWGKSVLITILYVVAAIAGTLILGEIFDLMIGDSLSKQFFGSILETVTNVCLVLPLGLGLTCFFTRLVSGERALIGNLLRPYRSRYWRNVILLGIEYAFFFIMGMISMIPIVIAIGMAALETVDPQNLSAARLMEESLMSNDVLFPLLIASGISTLILSVIFAIFLPPVAISYYIASVTKKITARDTIRRSFQLLKGHKKQFWTLALRLTGWYILGAITCGIGFLWVGPYSMTTFAVFYQEIKNQYALEHPEA